MPRKARLLIPNCPHHVVQRGHNRKAVFVADDDYLYYLENLKRETKGTNKGDRSIFCFGSLAESAQQRRLKLRFSTPTYDSGEDVDFYDSAEAAYIAGGGDPDAVRGQRGQIYFRKQQRVQIYFPCNRMTWLINQRSDYAKEGENVDTQLSASCCPARSQSKGGLRCG